MQKLRCFFVRFCFYFHHALPLKLVFKKYALAVKEMNDVFLGDFANIPHEKKLTSGLVHNNFN